MPQWKTSTKITDLNDEYDNGFITIHELGKKMRERFSLNPYYQSSEKFQNIVNSFGNVYSVVEYDTVLYHLYNFADAGNRIWIES